MVTSSSKLEVIIPVGNLSSKNSTEFIHSLLPSQPPNYEAYFPNEQQTNKQTTNKQTNNKQTNTHNLFQASPDFNHGLGHCILVSSDGDLVLHHRGRGNVDTSTSLVCNGFESRAIGTDDEGMVLFVDFKTFKSQFSLFVSVCVCVNKRKLGVCVCVLAYVIVCTC